MKTTIISISLFLILITAGFYLRGDQKTKVIINLDPQHRAKVIEIKTSENNKVTHNPVNIQRTPAQVATFNTRRAVSSPKQLDPNILELHYQLDENVYLAKNITAIAKTKYHDSMGPVIFEDRNFRYITSADLPSGKLSIFDTAKQRLMPISHVIKIPHTNQARRIEITSRGFKENLYFEKLELLFVETNTADFSVVYEELKAEGFNPEYQIINRYYHPR